MSERDNPEPSELIYPPGASWAPAMIGLGLAVVVAGTFSAWWWSVLGAVVVIAGARSWWHRGDDEISRMRREQPLDTAVIPAEPVRRGGSGS